MYYLQSRYYDPEIRRFINADSIVNNSLNGTNIYIYCENNPVNMLDYSGHMAEEAVGVFIGGIAAMLLQAIWKEIETACQKALKRISNTIVGSQSNVFSKKERDYQTEIKLQIDQSFSRVRAIPWYEGQNATHHIVAKSAKKAEFSRAIFREVGISLDDANNLITLKRGLHQRIHTGIYFEWINHEMKEAYESSSSKIEANENVRNSLNYIREILLVWNEASPF
jgi:hypothetical protein